MGATPGQVSTSSSVEVVFVLCCYIIGSLFYAIIIGIISTIVQSLDLSGALYVEKIQMWKVSRRYLTRWYRIIF